MASRSAALWALGLYPSLMSLLACSSILGIEKLEPEPPLLSSLSVNVGTLVPAFSPGVTNYVVELPVAASSVEVSAMGGVGVTETTLDQQSFQNSTTISVELEARTVLIEAIRGDGVKEIVSLELIRGAAWSQHSVIKDNPIEGGKFGSQIDADGTLFVGARGTAPGLEGVALFELIANVWTTRLIPGPPNCSEVSGAGEYGAAVAVRANQVIVGAPSCANTSGFLGGAAQQIYRPNADWLTNAAFRGGTDPALATRYGTDAAMSDDALGVTLIETSDGSPLVVEFRELIDDEWAPYSGLNGALLGTTGDPLTIESNGPLFVVARNRDFLVWNPRSGSGPSVVHQGTVSAPVTSIGFAGDTVVVGAAADNNEAGVVFVVRRATDSTVYELEATLRPINAAAGDLFGTAVSLVGDMLVVGAPGESSASPGINGDQENDTAPDSGAAYVFVRNGSTWTQVAYVKASNVGAGDGFGASVEILDDRFLVGAPGEDSTIDPTSDDLTDAGAVYFFE